jgi:hypothetical protein
MTRRFGFVLAIAAMAAFAHGISLLVRQESGFDKIGQFAIPHARQAVAVSEEFLFGIDDSAIGQYDKETGALLASWKAPASSLIKHLNSGIVIGEKLLAAHSNYPDYPIRNSLESWDSETLAYAGTRNLSGQYGYAVWVDRFDQSWWVAFAHYEKTRPKTGFGSENTILVRFNDSWKELDSWVYPGELIQRMAPKSNSGGAWGPHGILYLTGHDSAEVYATFPDPAKDQLTLLDVFPIDNAGQGIAWDPSNSDVLFAMKRSGRIVTYSKLGVSWLRKFRWRLIGFRPISVMSQFDSSSVVASSLIQ